MKFTVFVGTPQLKVITNDLKEPCQPQSADDIILMSSCRSYQSIYYIAWLRMIVWLAVELTSHET